MRVRRDWHVLPQATPSELAALGIPGPVVGQLLINRGIRTAADAKSFLDPGAVSSDDPFDLPQADRAVRRLAKSVRNGERIGIFGDFDADGITSAAVLTEGLRALGARLVPYIPDRVREGHGLNMPAIQYLRGGGVSLIVTADCGVSSLGEVAAAAELGVDIIITDHHSPPSVLPDALAVVNPKLNGSSPVYRDLASCGVAYTLIDALYADLGRPRDETLLELVALGTIADLAPMRGLVNRRMVHRGLQLLNSSRRPGIQELLKVSHVEYGKVDAEAVSYALGPRINAPGRVDHANASYQLLVSRTREEAAPLAQELNTRNEQRQKLTREILERMHEHVADPLPPILILGDSEFHPGVVGLAAGKLTEECHRPAIVCQIGPEETRGSCRSIPEFNIIEALRKCDGLFTRYGGHAQAAGFTMPTRNLPALRERLTDIAGAILGSHDLTPRLVIDAELPMERINGGAIRALSAFAPCGPENPSPVFLSRGVQIKETRSMGGEGQHLRLTLRAGGVIWSAVAFDAPQVNGSSLLDMVYSISVNRFGGNDQLQMRVLDMAPSINAPRLV